MKDIDLYNIESFLVIFHRTFDKLFANFGFTSNVDDVSTEYNSGTIHYTNGNYTVEMHANMYFIDQMFDFSFNLKYNSTFKKFQLQFKEVAENFFKVEIQRYKILPASELEKVFETVNIDMNKYMLEFLKKDKAFTRNLYTYYRNKMRKFRKRGIEITIYQPKD